MARKSRGLGWTEALLGIMGLPVTERMQGRNQKGQRRLDAKKWYYKLKRNKILRQKRKRRRKRQEWRDQTREGGAQYGKGIALDRREGGAGDEGDEEGELSGCDSDPEDEVRCGKCGKAGCGDGGDEMLLCDSEDCAEAWHLR